MTRIAAALFLTVACTSTLSACATPGETERARLTTAELSTMRPQIADHLSCMAANARIYAGGAADLGVLVDTAAYTCRTKLLPLTAQLQTFNLSSEAQRSYIRAIETASRSVIADRILKARGSTDSAAKPPAGT